MWDAVKLAYKTNCTRQQNSWYMQAQYQKVKIVLQKKSTEQCHVIFAASNVVVAFNIG